MMQSLRWRVATWYAALLLVVIVLASLFLTTQLHGIVLDQARARVDRVGSRHRTLRRPVGRTGRIGEALPADQELAQPSNMEHWASPTTFIQLDTIRRLSDREKREHGRRDVQRERPAQQRRAGVLDAADIDRRNPGSRRASGIQRRHEADRAGRRATRSLPQHAQPDLGSDGVGAGLGHAGDRRGIVHHRVARDRSRSTR